MGREKVMQGLTRIGALGGIVFSCYAAGQVTESSKYAGEIRLPESSCSASVLETEIVSSLGVDGITLPASLDGRRSVIFINRQGISNEKTMAHETGHVAQICHEGINLLARYNNGQKQQIEQEADEIRDRILSEARLKELRAEIDAIIAQHKNEGN